MRGRRPGRSRNQIGEGGLGRGKEGPEADPVRLPEQPASATRLRRPSDAHADDRDDQHQMCHPLEEIDVAITMQGRRHSGTHAADRDN